MLPDFRSILFGAFLFYTNMKVPEKFLEDYIFETPDWELEEDGLYLNHSWIKQVRQMNLGKHGRADIIRFCKNMEYCGVPNERKGYNDFHIEIIELKKRYNRYSHYCTSSKIYARNKTVFNKKKVNNRPILYYILNWKNS